MILLAIYFKFYVIIFGFQCSCLAATNYYPVPGIKHFSSNDVNGTKLYVTRARESFLERLQREREQEQQKVKQKVGKL